jgi:hypothetical protein
VGTSTFFDAVVWLEPPLFLSRHTSRGPYNVRIAGKPTRLWLPVKGPTWYGASRPDRTTGMPDFPPPRLAKPVSAALWMHTSSQGRMRQRPLIAEAVRLRWSDPERAKEADPWPLGEGFDAEVGPWLSVVRDWLAAWRHEGRGEVDEEPTPRIRMGRLGGDEVVHGGGTALGGLHLWSRPLSTPSEFQAALAAASAGMELPPAHSLYGEAIAYARASRYREAVISACAAAEVALADCADRLLDAAGHDRDQRTELLERLTGVVDLYRLCATRREELPVSFGTVKHRLAGPRNAAAHTGTAPDEDAVRLALRATYDLLAISPLPSARTLKSRFASNRVA